MKITSGRNPLAVGVDYREEYPKVCYQSIQMKEAQPLPLDFTGQTGRCACFRKVLSALKRFAVKEEMQVSLVLPDMEKETIEQYMQEACEAGFLREQLQILSETQSLVSFVMEQTPDIWQHRVWLLEFDTDEIKATWLEVNRRAMPMLVKAGEPEYWHVGTLLEEAGTKSWHSWPKSGLEVARCRQSFWREQILMPEIIRKAGKRSVFTGEFFWRNRFMPEVPVQQRGIRVERKSIYF